VGGVKENDTLCLPKLLRELYMLLRGNYFPMDFFSKEWGVKEKDKLLGSLSSLEK
jgi:hypothetical protein